MNEQSSSILNLRPVSFTYKSDKKQTKQFGLIAEEVDKVFSGIVLHNENGQAETVQYQALPVLLLNELQKQDIVIKQLEKKSSLIDSLMIVNPGTHANGDVTATHHATTNKLSSDIHNAKETSLDSATITMVAKLIATNLFCNQAIQAVSNVHEGDTITACAGTSILLLNPDNVVDNCTIAFPSSPTNGQSFTIVLAQTQRINSITNDGNGTTIINGVTELPIASTGSTSVTYIYYSASNTWYRL